MCWKMLELRLFWIFAVLSIRIIKLAISSVWIQGEKLASITSCHWHQLDICKYVPWLSFEFRIEYAVFFHWEFRHQTMRVVIKYFETTSFQLYLQNPVKTCVSSKKWNFDCYVQQWSLHHVGDVAHFIRVFSNPIYHG